MKLHPPVPISFPGIGLRRLEALSRRGKYTQITDDGVHSNNNKTHADL
jgi:hypothetical protein